MTWGGGSSGASPKTAGACALLIQWWRRHNAGQEPSPAMLRALIVNGAQPMGSGGPVPNPREGWGRLNLDNILAPQTQRVLADQETLLAARGDTQGWLVRLADPKQPLKVTLAWTDPPGAVGTGTATASAVVNKLALRVEAGGRTYRGNQFQRGWSLAGGAPDREGWDNLQNVFLPAGEAPGLVRVTVSALEVTTNCLTNRPDTPQQDFALVITNALPEKSVTPTDVVVVIDPVASRAAGADDGDDFWAPDAEAGADAGDLAELDGKWWDARDAVGGAGPLDGDTDDASWWDEAQDVQWPGGFASGRTLRRCRWLSIPPCGGRWTWARAWSRAEWRATLCWPEEGAGRRSAGCGAWPVRAPAPFPWRWSWLWPSWRGGRSWG